MLSHVFIGVNDFDRAMAFYSPVLERMGLRVTLADNAGGTYTVTSDQAITVVNGTAATGDTITLAGIGTKTVTGLVANLSLDASNTGTTGVTTGATALTITADALAGNLTVDAAALADNTALTLSGGANGKTATVNNLAGDLVATGLVSALTVNLVDNAGDDDISVTTGSHTTSITGSISGDTVSVIATALADDAVLSTAGAGAITITDMKGDLNNTATGAVSVT